MHDFDRTMSELEYEGWAGEARNAFESPYVRSPLGAGEYEYESGADGEYEDPAFSEVEEMELATELMTVSNEEELDQFLGGLFKKAGRALGKFMKSGTGRALGGALRGIAKKALPVAGAALGSVLAPGVGTAIGGALGGAASNLFELEDEGLSPDEREFETARRFVRFAGSAARNAIRSDAGGQPPHRVAQAALVHAARRHAPGLVRHRARMRKMQHAGRIPTDQSSDAQGIEAVEAPGDDTYPAVPTDAAASSGEYEYPVDAYEFEFAPANEQAGLLTPEEEYEAAADLLGVASEYDLDALLGGLLKKAVHRSGSLLKKGVGQQLAGALKKVAGQTVPGVKQAIDLAKGLSSSASNARDMMNTAHKAGQVFGLELEGMSPEDREFEAARRVVRLASTAAAHAAQGSKSSASAPQIARTAMIRAAGSHAPGLLTGNRSSAQAGTSNAHNGGGGQAKTNGRWVRQGRHILLLEAAA